MLELLGELKGQQQELKREQQELPDLVAKRMMVAQERQYNLSDMTQTTWQEMGIRLVPIVCDRMEKCATPLCVIEDEERDTPEAAKKLREELKDCLGRVLSLEDVRGKKTFLTTKVHVNDLLWVLSGTTDLVIKVRRGLGANAVRVAIELKPRVEERHVFQAAAELVALSRQSYGKPFALLTDLQQHYVFFWFKEVDGVKVIAYLTVSFLLHVFEPFLVAAMVCLCGESVVDEMWPLFCFGVLSVMQASDGDHGREILRALVAAISAEGFLEEPGGPANPAVANAPTEFKAMWDGAQMGVVLHLGVDIEQLQGVMPPEELKEHVCDAMVRALAEQSVACGIDSSPTYFL